MNKIVVAKNVKYNIEKTLSVLESMRDGDNCGDLEEMILDMRSALDSLNGIKTEEMSIKINKNCR